MSSPFHYQGHIGPANTDAWRVMHWHNEILTRIVTDLNKNPPDYVTVLGPFQSGKTTLARQLMERLTRHHPEILHLYLDLGCLGSNATEESVSSFIPMVFADRIQEVLDPTWYTPDGRATIMDVIDSPRPQSLEELLEQYLWQLLLRLTTHQKVVMIIDQFRTLPDGLQNELLKVFRSLHNQRTGPLKKLSIVLLSAESPLVRDLGGTSPFNVGQQYHIPDFRREDLVVFLRRSQHALAGVTFSPEAIDYLFKQTEGHAVLVQRICSAASKGATKTALIAIDDILEGIASCYEHRDTLIASLLDISTLAPDALRVLRKLMLRHPTPSMGFLDGVATLMDRGIAKQHEGSRLCVFRCPLLRSLFIKKHMVSLEDLPDVTDIERTLLELPPVLDLLLNCALQREARSAIAKASAAQAPELRECDYHVVLQNMQGLAAELDMDGIRFFHSRYFSGDGQLPIALDDVYGLLAKFYGERGDPASGFWCDLPH